MITKDQALSANEFHFCPIPRQFTHYGHKPIGCTYSVGPKGGVKSNPVVARRNGNTQTWKRDTARFRVPVKHGLYDYGEITPDNAHNWYLPDDCPVCSGKGKEYEVFALETGQSFTIPANSPDQALAIMWHHLYGNPYDTIQESFSNDGRAYRTMYSTSIPARTLSIRLAELDN